MFSFKFVFTAFALAASLVAAGNWDVTVGGDAGLVFTPPSVHPQVGDTITFHFGMKNHSVTEGSFDYPCTPLPFGINSGFNPVSANSTESPIFVITVLNDEPLFLHCQQTGHCPGNGMVFAANVDDDTFAKYQAKAIALGNATIPIPGDGDDNEYSKDSKDKKKGSWKRAYPLPIRRSAGDE